MVTPTEFDWVVKIGHPGWHFSKRVLELSTTESSFVPEGTNGLKRTYATAVVTDLWRINAWACLCCACSRACERTLIMAFAAVNTSCWYSLYVHFVQLSPRFTATNTSTMTSAHSDMHYEVLFKKTQSATICVTSISGIND